VVGDTDFAAADARIDAVFRVLFRSPGKGTSERGLRVRCTDYNGPDKNVKRSEIPCVRTAGSGTIHGGTKAEGRTI
jgi:hypothetical protein